MRTNNFGKALFALVGAATVFLPVPPALAVWQPTTSSSTQYFVPDAYAGRKLANSSTAYRYVGAGTQRFDGAKQLVAKYPREVRTDLKNPFQQTLANGVYTVTKLVRSDKWNDAQYQTPWTLYNMKQKQYQTTNTFVFEWRDGVNGATLFTNDPNFEVGPWTNTGATEKDTINAAGADLWPSFVKEDANTTNQEVVLSKVPLSLASADAARAKSATFLSDSGSGGGSTAVAGSQKRAVFKADDAVVSESKKAEKPGKGGIQIELPGAGSTADPGRAPIVNASPTPAPTPAPLVASDWLGTWVSGPDARLKKGEYDYQIVFQDTDSTAKTVALNYTFDSWLNNTNQDRLPPTTNELGTKLSADMSSFIDDKGTMNANLNLVRDADGQLRVVGTVVMSGQKYNLNLFKR